MLRRRRVMLAKLSMRGWHGPVTRLMRAARSMPAWQRTVLRVAVERGVLKLPVRGMPPAPRNSVLVVGPAAETGIGLMAAMAMGAGRVMANLLGAPAKYRVVDLSDALRKGNDLLGGGPSPALLTRIVDPGDMVQKLETDILTVEAKYPGTIKIDPE